jgi:nitroreductase
MPHPDPAALQFLSQRRSYPAKIMSGPGPTPDELTPILTAALRVPDHGQLAPWRLIVLTGKALTRLADTAEARARALNLDAELTSKARGQFDRSPLAIAVVFAPKPSPKVPEVEQLYSTGALCVGILNAAQAAGWAACWLSGWVSHDRAFLTDAAHLAPHESLAGFIHIGRETTPATDRPRPDPATLTTWITA